MKFKKFFIILFSLFLFPISLITGCGGSNESAPNTDNIKTVKIGMITHLNATEQAMDEFYNKAIEQVNAVTFQKYEPKFYDSLSLMQMGLESGEVEMVSTYQNIADYVIANNDKYEVANKEELKVFTDNFCFAVRKDDTQLKADLDKTIDAMKADGSLDKLVKEYITDVDKKNPPAVELPMTDGADKIKVGITGDLPPLDYVRADDKPAGFNTAFLAEVAKRSGKNLEVVNIDSSARAAALSSGQIDVIFWVAVPDGDKFPADIDTPEGVELSAPYFKDSVAHLKLKDSK